MIRLFIFGPLLLCACGGAGSGTPGTTNRPQVFMTVPSSNVVGTSISVKVSINGCASVQTAELFHKDTSLKTFAFPQSPTTVTLSTQEIPFAVTGVPAHLSLTAQVTCDDGRQGTSQPVGAVFFPVQQTVEQGGALVVPEVFQAQGSGSSVRFVGCAGGDVSGTTELAMVDAQGNVVATQAELPVPCTVSTQFTDRDSSSHKRWVWNPGTTAYEIDDALHTTPAYFPDTGKPVTATLLGLMPGGDAVVYAAGDVLGEGVRYVSQSTGAAVWTYAPNGEVIGIPVRRAGTTATVVLPLLSYNITSRQASFEIEVRRQLDGVQTDLQTLYTWQYGIGDHVYRPATALSNDAATVYFSVRLVSGNTQVYACAAAYNGCSGGNLRWKSGELLEDASMIVPFNQGKTIAVVTSQLTWFLDAASGMVVNSGGEALAAGPGLVTLVVQPGKGSDFYLLNGPPQDPNNGAPITLPTEMVAVDAPGNTELLRYSVGAGSLYAGVDDSGQLWLRAGPNLAKPFSMATYRQMVSQ